MGATIGLYFAGLSNDEANTVRERLNALAAELGYVALAGATAGAGNAAALLVAIANGDVRLEPRQGSRIAAAASRIVAATASGGALAAVICGEWTANARPLLEGADQSYALHQAELWVDALAPILRREHGRRLGGRERYAALAAIRAAENARDRGAVS